MVTCMFILLSLFYIQELNFCLLSHLIMIGLTCQMIIILR